MPSALAVLRLMTSSYLVGCLHRQIGGLGAFENPDQHTPRPTAKRPGHLFHSS